MKQLFLLVFLLVGLNARGQGYVDQDAVETLLNSQTGDISNVQKVNWKVYEYKEYHENDGKGIWSEMLEHLDALPGERLDKRRYVVELASRVTGDKMRKGMKLFVPETFPEDYRAYSPYPFEYAEARELPKLFIIDKYTQTFGAYEYGRLVRWGLVSSGSTNGKTPPGKYSFTWKSEFRLSSAAPPGEVWEMPYMFNFEPKVGLHVHQYSLPISQPVSHGCVRVAMADAVWNYNWADGWGPDRKKKGTPVWVINNNPTGRAAHWKVDADGKVTSLVKLPGRVTEQLVNK